MVVIDAYAHIGYPRFGTPEELCAIWRQWRITKGCIALPPGMPDFDGLARARGALGERVRLFGIPFGADARSRVELAELQIRFGISGMRLAPSEMLSNPDLLSILGEAGRCLMAIGIHDHAALTRTMIDWLQRYPAGTIAAPHFLRPGPIDGNECSRAVADPGAFRELLRHPRMHAIFSRHGGVSVLAYPHDDLRPWIDDVLPLLGWDRVMWGSEIPVVYHRDEQVDSAQGWLASLGIPMDPRDEAGYLGGNADRLFFASSPPHEDVTFPAWVAGGLRAFIEANEPVPVVRSRPLDVPLDVHGRLMSAYLSYQADHPQARFQDWLVGRIAEHIGPIVS